MFVTNRSIIPQVSQFFSHPRVRDTVVLHNQLVEASLQGRLLAPTHPDSQRLAEDIMVRSKQSNSRQAEELKRILQKPAVKVQKIGFVLYGVKGCVVSLGKSAL